MKEIRSIEGSEFRIVPEKRQIEGYVLKNLIYKSTKKFNL